MSAQRIDVAILVPKSKSCGAETQNNAAGPGWLVVIFLCPAIGCSAGVETNTVPVSGIVSYNGQPVEGAEVALLPADRSSDARPARGTTETDGTFKVKTYFNQDVDEPGARPGQYTVTVTKIEPPNGLTIEEWSRANYNDPRSVPPLRHLVPVKYGNALNSDLSVTVQKDSKNHFSLGLRD